MTSPVCTLASAVGAGGLFFDRRHRRAGATLAVDVIVSVPVAGFGRSSPPRCLAAPDIE
ncbi:hypothetical protein [Nocardia abscessus]|uniref:hypothetical protein n=1 Tax=Nocardia abscessus TaxID=120957 RepID=UPI0024567EA8|nr:hypothetical protein [Nocardia abscessus]